MEGYSGDQTRARVNNRASTRPVTLNGSTDVQHHPATHYHHKTKGSHLKHQASVSVRSITPPFLERIRKLGRIRKHALLKLIKFLSYRPSKGIELFSEQDIFNLQIECNRKKFNKSARVDYDESKSSFFFPLCKEMRFSINKFVVFISFTY